jgi:hypothetical protein
VRYGVFAWTISDPTNLSSHTKVGIDNKHFRIEVIEDEQPPIAQLTHRRNAR